LDYLIDAEGKCVSADVLNSCTSNMCSTRGDVLPYEANPE